MLEYPKALRTFIVIKVTIVMDDLQFIVIKWTISRKPNYTSNVKVGSSETIRDAVPYLLF